MRRRLAASGLFAAVLALCSVVLARQRADGQASHPPSPPEEWPSHLHDSAGTRFSPLTQITPANVAQLKVAWTYHLKGASGAVPAPDRQALPPDAAASGRVAGEGAAPARGAGARGRGGTGFSQSEMTPIVASGVMYIATPYGRVAALDPTSGKETW